MKNENTPVGFPTNVPVKQEIFSNWAKAIVEPNIWTCAPANENDVVDVCNWAAKNGWTVRVRGIMHNWSPLAVTPNLPNYDKLLLVDTTVSLKKINFIPSTDEMGPAVSVGTGATMGALLKFLEEIPDGKGAASGYSFVHVPAPGNLTVGGVISINAHGTAISTPPNDDFKTTYGSMSNRILSLTAIVTEPKSSNPTTYQLKTFKRGDKDLTALMTQLGRTMITNVILQVTENFNLRCLSITDIDKETLFKAQTGAVPPFNSCGDFLNKSGRIEVIWFPFTSYPWLKVWTVEATKPVASRKVDGPNNYPFSDNLPDFVVKMIDMIMSTAPGLTENFGQLMLKMTNEGLDGNILGFPIYDQSRDIWGPSKNTMLYVKDTTLRVTANGYAVLMNRNDVQQAISDFATQFETMLLKYKNKDKFPINSPLEIRVTGLDSGNDMPSFTNEPAGRPVISSLATDAETIKNNWDVALWLDVLTIPGTKYSDEFYKELEEWLLNHFTTPKAKVVPEWSKGWAYTLSGAWTNDIFMDTIKKGFTDHRDADDNWAWETSTLAKYDSHNIYQSKLTKKLF
jgi:hypothetical protein